MEVLQPDIPLRDAHALLCSHPEARALFESPEHVEALHLPAETKAFIRALRNPTNGHLVFLIGTTHASRSSPDDVRMLIETVEPQVVAVELDPPRLHAFETEGRGSLKDDLDTIPKALYQRWTNPHPLLLWGAYAAVFIAQALGTGYGADMQSAIQTARRLNTPVEPIDQDNRIIKARAMKALLAPRKGTGGGNKPKRNDTQGKEIRVLEDFQLAFSACDDLEGAKRAFWRVFAAFSQGRPPPLEDVAAYRACGSKAIETLRLAHVNGQLRKHTDLEDALLKERDKIMGFALARLADEYKEVVAVVGAAHVPGVTSNFAKSTLERFINLQGRRLAEVAEKFVTKLKHSYFKALEEMALIDSRAGPPRQPPITPGDVATATGLGCMAMVGVYACSKRPRLMLKLGAGTGFAYGAYQLACAALTAKWCQFGAYLEGAAQLEHSVQPGGRVL